jgi:hypothetical protein
MKLMAVKVLPLPVAIWISARGLLAAIAPFAKQLGHGADASEEGKRCEIDVQSSAAAAGGEDRRLRQRLEPFAERCRLVEGEDVAGAWLGVEAVAEVRFGAGRFVDEGQRPAPCRQAARQALRITRRLDLDASERRAPLLGFDDAGGPAIDVQQVVGKAVPGFEREFAQRDATRGVDVGRGNVLHRPAGGGQ